MFFRPSNLANGNPFRCRGLSLYRKCGETEIVLRALTLLSRPYSQRRNDGCDEKYNGFDGDGDDDTNDDDDDDDDVDNDEAGDVDKDDADDDDVGVYGVEEEEDDDADDDEITMDMNMWRCIKVMPLMIMMMMTMFSMMVHL